MEQLEHSVLDDLGVHHEVGQLLGLAQAVEHGVGHVAHAALQGQELFGETAGHVFADEEADHVVTDFGRGLVDGGEGLHTVVLVGVDDAHHLCGVNLQIGQTDAVVGVVDGNLAAIGRIGGQIDVVHAVEARGQLVVDFDENLLGHLGIGGDVAHAAAEEHLAVVGDVGGLDDGEVHVAVEVVACLLSHLREVTVVVVDVVGVDACAGAGEVLVGGAHVDGVVLRQDRVDVAVGGSAGEDVYFVFPACLMLFLCFGGNALRDALGGAGSGKARKSEGGAVFDDRRGLFRGDFIKCHGSDENVFFDWSYGVILFFRNFVQNYQLTDNHTNFY